MNRLQYIVTDVIDQALKAHYFDNVKFNGLCEAEVKDGKTIPVKYKGYGDFEFVGFDDSHGLNIYHRLISTSHEDDIEAGFGNNPLKQETYSFTLIAFGNQRDIVDSNNNINYKIADELKSLIPRRLTKVQLVNIDAHSGVINVTGTNHNKSEVFAQELPENTNKVKPETLLFSIQYNLVLKFIGDCKTLACDSTVPFLNLSDLSCANINDPDFGITDAKKLECGIDDNTLTFILQDGVTDFTFTINAGDAGTFKLDAATFINATAVVFELNTVVVTGDTPLEGGDLLKVTPTITNAALLSQVEITT